MSRSHLLLVLSLLSLLSLLALSTPPAAQIEAPPRLKNTRLDAAVFEIAGPWAAIGVSESGQSFTDLNGDGDTGDRVLQLLNLEHGRRVNLGAAGFTNFLAMNEEVFFFGVDERSQGNADLNGDGDASDVIARVHDFRTRSTHELGLALSPNGRSTIDADWVTFMVFEFDANQRLNDDGDLNDYVLHTYHIPSGEVTNHAISVQRSNLQAVQPRQSGPWVGFAVQEAQEGMRDRNGDGDRSDAVMAVLDARTGEITNLGLAVGSLLERPETIAFDGSLLAFVVHEEFQGADLNGDGDQDDLVPHVWDAEDGSVTNLGLASVGPVELDAPQLAFRVQEPGLGDLNGDGDTDDAVVHLHDARTRTTRNLALATGPASEPGNLLQLDHGLLVFQVEELAQGAEDLNGDGDFADLVAHVASVEFPPVRNLGIAVREAFIGPKLLALYVPEMDQGERDLNGDGDRRDEVIHIYRRADASLVNSGLAGTSSVRHTRDGLAYLQVSERDQGQDINGSGLAVDQLLFRTDGTLFEPFLGFTHAFVFEGQSGGRILQTSEVLSGKDYTGDGDTRDSVPFLFVDRLEALSSPSPSSRVR